MLLHLRPTMEFINMKPKYKAIVKIVFGANSKEVIIAEREFAFRWQAQIFALCHAGKTSQLHKYLKPWVYQFVDIEEIV